MEEKTFFMKKALKEAEKAYNKGEVPVGAVIVKDGKIISRGHIKAKFKRNKKRYNNACRNYCNRKSK